MLVLSSLVERHSFHAVGGEWARRAWEAQFVPRPRQLHTLRDSCLQVPLP